MLVIGGVEETCDIASKVELSRQICDNERDRGKGPGGFEKI